MEELGKRLQDFRLENGWSKRAVAQLLQVSVPSIMRWEDGISIPNDYNRFKIERLMEGYEPPARRRLSRSIVQLSLFPERIPNTLAQT